MQPESKQKTVFFVFIMTLFTHCCFTLALFFVALSVKVMNINVKDTYV